MPELEPNVLFILAGLLCGCIMGSAARLVRFCTFGGIEDVVLAHSTVRLRTWFLAMAVAILATQVSAALSYIDLSQSNHHLMAFQPVAAALGGIMFGFGMALAGNCGFGTVIRMSSGDMRALAVFVTMGITAYMTARGIFSPLRHLLFDPFSVGFSPTTVDIPNALKAAFGLPVFVTIAVLPLLLLWWCFSSPSFAGSYKDVFVGTVVGLTIGLGFMFTSMISESALQDGQVESLSYALPPGDTLIYLMTFTGTQMDFAVASILGTITGAFGVALIRKEIHLEGFDEPRDMRRHVLGAMLMGSGGVIAGGCTVGQGLSGMATLSLNAPISVLGILLGGAAGVQYLVGGRVFDILGALASRDLK